MIGNQYRTLTGLSRGLIPEKNLADHAIRVYRSRFRRSPDRTLGSQVRLRCAAVDTAPVQPAACRASTCVTSAAAPRETANFCTRRIAGAWRGSPSRHAFRLEVQAGLRTTRLRYWRASPHVLCPDSRELHIAGRLARTVRTHASRTLCTAEAAVGVADSTSRPRNVSSPIQRQTARRAPHRATECGPQGFGQPHRAISDARRVAHIASW